MKSYEMKEILKKLLGSDQLLDELNQAMSEKEALENFQHIADMHDIDFNEED